MFLPCISTFDHCGIIGLSFKLGSNKKIWKKPVRPNQILQASADPGTGEKICAVQAENVSSVFTLAPVIMYEPVLPKWGKLWALVYDHDIDT